MPTPLDIVTLYIIEWKNVEGADMSIYIYDSLLALQEIYPSLDVNPINLKPGTEPLIISYTNTGERLDTPILGRVATMQFINTSNQFLSLFSGGEDNRFYVEIAKNRGTGSAAEVFRGFTIMEDNLEPYVPPGANVTLTATDNLGLLKGIEMVDLDGERFKNEHKIIDYVIACLRQTNLSLSVNVVNNLYEDSHENRSVDTNKCAWYQTHVNALTFEKEINEAEDCYTVLEKILLSWGMRLSYYQGAWWIVRTDEYKNSLVSYSTYDQDGVLLTDGTINASLLKAMGHAGTYDVFFINEETIVRESRPSKSAKKTFSYEYPKEIICNINFERGVKDDALSTDDYDALTPECWTLYKAWPNVTLDTDGFIKVGHDAAGYEEGRSLFIAEAPANALYYFASDERIPVNANDKFSFSVDFRYSTGSGITGGGGIATAWVRLHGDDGTKWNMNEDGEWVQANSAFTTGTTFVSYVNSASADFTEWQSVSVDSLKIPVSGEIEIFLMNGLNSDDQDKEFQNIRFTYNPYINNSYIGNDGEYYKVSHDGDYSAFEDDKLFLSDSPRKLFKGSMLINSTVIFSGNSTFVTGNAFSVLGNQTAIFTAALVVQVSGTTLNNRSFTVVSSAFIGGQTDVTVTEATVAEFSNAIYETPGGTNYNLTSRWNDMSITPNGLGYERFAKWQLYWVWNQVRTEKRLFDMTLKGLNSNTTDYCDLIHKYYNNVYSLHNRNKYFIILHCEQNWMTCQWRATMQEIDDIGDSRTYGDDFLFKYIAK